uniref:Caspase domain-containing protein n=1 Tax=Candidatus Kentrum sp. FW TaxID=2126338 RepID=A0A450TCM9_9GAMM|nr:MAG: hypothetical protein BECKFW1821B_GA0114236_10958 [Candidatus Kentron sp. FW]
MGYCCTVAATPLLTHDYDRQTDAADNLMMIGAHEIMTALQKIPSLSQTIILDTCRVGSILHQSR